MDESLETFPNHKSHEISNKKGHIQCTKLPLCRVWERWLVGTLTPFFGEDEILVQGTKKRVMGTKSNTLSPNI